MNVRGNSIRNGGLNRNRSVFCSVEIWKIYPQLVIISPGIKNSIDSSLETFAIINNDRATNIWNIRRYISISMVEPTRFLHISHKRTYIIRIPQIGGRRYHFATFEFALSLFQD